MLSRTLLQAVQNSGSTTTTVLSRVIHLGSINGTQRLASLEVGILPPASPAAYRLCDFVLHFRGETVVCHNFEGSLSDYLSFLSVTPIKQDPQN